MASLNAFATIFGIAIGAVAFVATVWMARNQAIEHGPRRAAPSTSKAEPKTTVRRGQCDFCNEQGGTIRACQHAFHDSCFALCRNKCPLCSPEQEKSR